LCLMADALAKKLREPFPAAAALAAKIVDGLRRGHKHVRSLSHGLVPVEVDPEGLRAALQDLAARSRVQARTRCTFDSTGPIPVIDTASATHLFRIAQEAVSNALRHGRAPQIQITLRATPDALTLGVQDDGVGIPAAAIEDKGLGIRL